MQMTILNNSDFIIVYLSGRMQICGELGQIKIGAVHPPRKAAQVAAAAGGAGNVQFSQRDSGGVPDQRQHQRQPQHFPLQARPRSRVNKASKLGARLN